MTEQYDLKNINKKSKKSSIAGELSEEAQREAENIEKGNLSKARKAREALEKAEEKQKGTTDEMRRQNEKLERARQAGLNIYENVDKADRQAVEIEKEEKPFDPLSKTKTKVTNWMNKDTGAQEDIKSMKKRKIKNEDTPKLPKLPKLGEEKEATETEKGTNKELGKILQATKNIQKETEIQSRVGQEQDTKLREISRTTKYSKKKAENADKRLKKNL